MESITLNEKGIVQQFLSRTKQGANFWYALMEFINNLPGIHASKLHFFFNKKEKKIIIHNNGDVFTDLRKFCESFKYGNGNSALSQYHVGVKTSSIILGNCLNGNESYLEIVTKDDNICQKAKFKFGYDNESPIECTSFETITDYDYVTYENGTTFIIGNAESLLFSKNFYTKFAKLIGLMHSPFLRKHGIEVYINDDENVCKEISTKDLNEDGSIVINDRYYVEEALQMGRSGKKFFQVNGIFYWYRVYEVRDKDGKNRKIETLYNFVPRSKYSNEEWKNVRDGYYLCMGGEIGYIDGVYVNMLNSLLNYYPETRTFNGKSEGFAYLFNTGGGDRSCAIRVLDNCLDIIEVSSEKMKGMINFPDNPKMDQWFLVDEENKETTDVTLIAAFAHDFYKVLNYNKQFDAPKCVDKTCDYFAESNIQSFEKYITEYDVEHSLKARCKGKKSIRNIIQADGEVIDVIDYNNPNAVVINTKLIQDGVAKEVFITDEELASVSKQDRRLLFAAILAWERCKKIPRENFKAYLVELKQILLNDGGYSNEQKSYN